MLRARLISTLPAAAIGLLVLAGQVYAQPGASPGALYDMPIPGGLEAALRVAGDRAPADRGHFLIEVIRRIHDVPPTVKTQRDLVLLTLVSHLEKAPILNSQDTVPLPLPASFWLGTVFEGRAGTHPLMPAILRSRTASLLYAGLLALDDETRTWLAAHPDLAGEIALKHAAALAIAAPALRIRDGAMRLPGGPAVEPVWQALLGKKPSEPAEFIRAALTRLEGRFAYFLAAMGQLSDAQVRYAMGLQGADPASRIDVARHLLGVFERLSTGWKIEERAFWRPTLDPALLAAEITVDAAGAPSVPGTKAFWTPLFSDASTPGGDVQALIAGEPADFPWLCEQVFKGGQVVQRKPYEMVLFASRVIPRLTPENVRDAMEAVRAAGTFPALSTALERAGVTNVAVFAAAARRATQLSTIETDARGARTITQFQASIALLTRGALRASLSASELGAHVISVSAIAPDERTGYDGRLVRWWAGVLGTDGAGSSAPAAGTHVAWIGDPSVQRYDDAVGSMDRDAIRFLAGRGADKPPLIEWEGTRYRVDLPWAEATRLGKVLGAEARPYLSSALALMQMAATVSEPAIDAAAVREHVAVATELMKVVPSPGLTNALTPISRAGGDARAAQRLAGSAGSLRQLADELAARGLSELAYAVALGHVDGALMSASDAASRHDFGFRLFGKSGAWRPPVTGADRVRDWHATGALLGLDVRLAELALVRVSSRPPARPTLNDADRRVLIEAVALTEPAALTDAGRDSVVAAIRKGRERLAAARTPAAVLVLADEIGLTGVRRTLLGWSAAHDAARVPALLSLSELLWLGQETRPLDPSLHVWGASAEPRLGCLCRQLPAHRTLDMFAGRWDSGIFASAFSDLTLRLGEVLAEMQMPAPLVASVLPAATIDFIDGVVSRGPDDHRGLHEFVQTIKPDRVELYLALLTTDGPLVAVGQTTDPPAAGSVRKTRDVR